MAPVMVRAVGCIRVQRSHGFDTSAVNVEFVVGKVALSDRVLGAFAKTR